MSTNVIPKVEVWFDLGAQGGDFFTIGHPTRGRLGAYGGDQYGLAGDIAVDISDSVYDIQIRRGRTREIDEIETGTATLGLRNYDGDFLPDELYTDGTNPYGAGNIVPGKRIRISWVGLGNPIAVFDGVIDDWDYEYGADLSVDCTITAMDCLGQLAAIDFDDWTTTGSQTAGERLNAVLDRSEVKWPGSNRDFDDGINDLQSDNVSHGSNVLNYCQLVSRSDLGRLFASRQGVLTFRDRRSVVPTTNDPLVFSTVSANGNHFHGLRVRYGSELLFTRVGVDREGGNLQTVEDDDGIDAYGVRTLSLPGLLLSSDSESNAMATALLGYYSEPQLVIDELLVKTDDFIVDRDFGGLGTTMSLDIGSLIDVEWLPRGMSSTVTQTSIVEGITHSVTVGATWDVTLQLSPATNAPFIIEHETLGRLGTGGGLIY